MRPTKEIKGTKLRGQVAKESVGISGKRSERVLLSPSREVEGNQGVISTVEAMGHDRGPFGSRMRSSPGRRSGSAIARHLLILYLFERAQAQATRGGGSAGANAMGHSGTAWVTE